MMRFLDANVFLFASLDSGPTGAAARETLKTLSPDRPAATNVIALNEVFWALRKEGGREKALQESRRIRQAKGLRILDIEPSHWDDALDLMEKFAHLKPNDALHAATANAAGIREIVSADPDFDGLPNLKRIPL